MWIKLYFVKIFVKNIYRVFLYNIIVAILNFSDEILWLFFFKRMSNKIKIITLDNA